MVIVRLDDGPVGSAEPRDPRGWWWSWTRWATLGEFVGFAVPATVAVVVAGWSPVAAVPALVAAGAMEGALLGWSQSRVLCRRVPEIRPAAWIAATAAAAAVAWSIGMVPSVTEGRWPAWPAPVLVAVAILLGLTLLGSIGTAQWWVLRRAVPGSWWWIPATAGGWGVGLAVFTGFTTALWQPGQGGVVIAVIGVTGGLLMAAAVAALTGLAFVRIDPTRALSADRTAPSDGVRTRPPTR